MDKTLTMRDAMTSMNLSESEQVKSEKLSGVVPSSILNSDIKNNIIILGITPDSFVKEFAAVEFDFQNLRMEFKKHCKDFDDDLSLNMPSKALEFSAKILFEVGPYIRMEEKGERNGKKSKGYKAITFRFPYVKTDKELSCHTVIVSKFRANVYIINDNTDKTMIMTFKQAGMLAMVTFNKVIALAYNNDASVLMTPLCGAVYSRESIKEMASELSMGEVDIIKMINSSTATGGQHLIESDLACAIVSTIATTKRVASKDFRNSMITHIIKQYCAEHKQYDSNKFSVISKYALGGVPQGMDADTLIENFKNIQINEVNPRVRALAVKQSETKVKVAGLSTDGLTTLERSINSTAVGAKKIQDGMRK